MKVFSIIYSNMTGKLFAWEGDRKSQAKYLGNRVVIGTVNAVDSDSAVNVWKNQNL
jgi:hypothetical protein